MTYLEKLLNDHAIAIAEFHTFTVHTPTSEVISNTQKREQLRQLIIEERDNEREDDMVNLD